MQTYELKLFTVEFGCLYPVIRALDLVLISNGRAYQQRLEKHLPLRGFIYRDLGYAAFLPSYKHQNKWGTVLEIATSELGSSRCIYIEYSQDSRLIHNGRKKRDPSRTAVSMDDIEKVCAMIIANGSFRKR
jgi:hypothetical protein